MTRAQVKEEALKLPEDERRDLLESLQNSLEDAEALPEWQRRLLDERLEDMERHPDDWVSLEEALESLKAKLLV